MSFSTNIPRNTPASKARELNAVDFNTPRMVKAYIDCALANLQKHYGADVEVDVNCYGHLHNGEAGNYDVSTATIDVRRSPTPTV